MAKTTNKIITTIILIALAIVYYTLDSESKRHTQNRLNASAKENHQTVLEYFNQKISGEMVTLDVEVIKILSDDNHPPRHQRFIVKLDNSLTVLVSHNIDLAPRVKDLTKGDHVKVTGQYEWNEKGGVIHWTHHDPQGNRDGGQVIHKGKTYR